MLYNPLYQSFWGRVQLRVICVVLLACTEPFSTYRMYMCSDSTVWVLDFTHSSHYRPSIYRVVHPPLRNPHTPNLTRKQKQRRIPTSSLSKHKHR